MKVLALDTTTPACSVALAYGDQTLFRFQLASREHTQLILPMIDDILAEADLPLTELDALAFTHGPGSFTGIRIGFGVVQGLAFGADLPVVPVSSLETLATTAVRHLELGNACQVMPMFDARMDEIYWASFCWRDNELQRVVADSLDAPEQINTPCSDLPIVGIGDGWHLRERIALSPQLVEPSLMPDARDVLQIALPMVANGAGKAVDEVQPLYLRDKVSWKKRQRLRDQQGSHQ
ncbi:MAG: tRNA (adenosine(37)-N6)-threonylcarbamoyltransferase complex dimerization subunit type 1 TsaB [Porticoccaceae bacterium]